MAQAKLTARKVETAKPGKHADGGNLYLIVSPTGGRKWVLRFTWRGQAKEMGLGGADVVSLVAARVRAQAARELVEKGLNPIDERKRDNGVPTFGKMADDVIADLTPGFRNEKHRAQWKMTLEVYAAPLRDRPVDAIQTEDVLAALKPIWRDKPETASRVRGRIEKVLNAAKARGFRSGENPALWRGHLENLLPKQSKLARGHHAALPYKSVPAFVARLRERESMSALALEFCILTAARSGEVLQAEWTEFDLDVATWTVPANKMKAGREHRVPLTPRAVEIVRTLQKAKTNAFVFPGQARGKPLSNMAMEMQLRRMKVEDVTVHGFRSAFRDWAGNETGFPRELAEQALAHVIGDKAEQAYRRGDALERRRELMAAWSNHCEPSPAANVVPMARRAAGS